MPISWNYNEVTYIVFVIEFYCYFTYAQLCYCCYVVCVNWEFLFLVATNCSFVALENNVLNSCKSIMFPSLAVSTLYGTIILTWLDDVFRLDVLYWILDIRINRFYIHHVHIIFFFLVLVWLLFWVVDCSTSYTSEDLSKVVDLAILCTFLTIGQASFGGRQEPQ